MKGFFLACLCGISYSFASLVYVIGDSHVREFVGIPFVQTKHLGPITMHRIGRDQLGALDLRSLGVREKDIAVFVFGEIDVRCHVGKQRDFANRSLEEVMETLVSKYLETILINRALFQDLTCVVYNIPPPSDAGDSSDYPRYGSLEERVELTKQLNRVLKAACLVHGIEFLDVYDHFADEYGSLRPELSDGNVHINYRFNQPIRDRILRIYQALLRK